MNDKIDIENLKKGFEKLEDIADIVADGKDNDGYYF